MGAVVIGMDPHKRSATIEVMGGDETILGGGRYATDVAGYNAMLKFGKQFEQRMWAIPIGCPAVINFFTETRSSLREQEADLIQNWRLRVVGWNRG
jgi:hypothetical protein